MSENSENIVEKLNVLNTEIGKKIKAKRKELKMTQSVLSEKLDITFQQLQKYEKGSNRISACRLYCVAQALGVDIGYFFEG